MSQHGTRTATGSRRRVILIIAIALVLVVAIAAVGVSCATSSGDDTGPPTVQVDRGRVALAVSASGSIAPSGQQNLGFADGGTVTGVFVNVGDRVEAGQVLARVDDTVARQTLAQRRSLLDQQLATLNKLVTGNSVETAQATLNQALVSEQATRAQTDATVAANRSATARAQAQLRFDEASLDRAEDQLDADRSACADSPRTTTATPAPAAAAAAPAAAAPAAGAPVAAAPAAGAPVAGGGVVPTGAQPVPTQPVPTQPVPTQPVPTQPVPTQPVPTQPVPTQPVPTQPVPTQPVPTTAPPTTSVPTATTAPGPTTTVTTEPEEPEEPERPGRPADPDDDRDDDGGSDRRSGSDSGSVSDDEESVPVVTTRVAMRAASSPLGDLDDDVEDANERTSPSCSRLLSDRQAVEQAQGAVLTARTNLTAAEQRERTDVASGQVSIENARASVVTAQNQLATAGNDRPDDIAAQEAQVRDARAGVEIAQRDVEETVIAAPVAGIVTAINGVSGEVVSPPSATTALAPGGTAPLPAESGGTASAAGGAARAAAFLTLNSADPFQLVVPFEEADAARILPGQVVDVAVDALPNDPLTGRVVSVGPSGQDLAGIVSYYASVVVVGGADRLRDGQTAEANVRVEAVENALRVPAAAVRREDGRPTVTVAGPDGNPVSIPFLAGLVGDDFVEVRSGLSEGDEVQLPQATVTPIEGEGGPPPSN